MVGLACAATRGGHVVMVREGEVVHRTRVRGRRPAAKLLNELADEISRTPDEKLHG